MILKFFLRVSPLIILLLCGCNENRVNEDRRIDTPSNSNSRIIHDTIYLERGVNSDWQKDFGLSHDPKKDSIWNKPVFYYISDPDCAGIAQDFYYGYFRPSDNGATNDFLKLASTDNKKLRPFYRWCLNKTLIISDGALAELVGVPARQYAEKFPDEFFEYLDNNKNDEKYQVWVDAILYSGFFDYENYDDNLANRKKLIERMIGHLKTHNQKNIARIERFAIDCTPEEDPLK